MNTNTNYLYIGGAVLIIILGLVLFGRSGVEETTDEFATTTIPSDISKLPTGASPSVSKPVGQTPTSPVPTPAPSQTPTPSYVPTALSLANSIYKLTSYNGETLPTSVKYILSFENGVLNAKFCNNFGGDFVLDKSLLKVPNLVSTRMYCNLPTSLMEMENTLISMLSLGATIYRSGNTIILSRPQNAVMVFTEI